MANTWTWITGKNSKLLQKIGRNTQKRKLNGTFLYLSVMPQIKCFPPADSLHCVISSNNCDFSRVVWSAYICERHKVIAESLWPWLPQERTDQQACWPVTSYSWNVMLWILSTFSSTIIGGLSRTYSLSNLRAEQRWPWRTCTESHNQNFGSLSVANFITQREGKISFHLWTLYTRSNDLHFIAWPILLSAALTITEQSKVPRKKIKSSHLQM